MAADDPFPPRSRAELLAEVRRRAARRRRRRQSGLAAGVVAVGAAIATPLALAGTDRPSPVRVATAPTAPASTTGQPNPPMSSTPSTGIVGPVPTTAPAVTPPPTTAAQATNLPGTTVTAPTTTASPTTAAGEPRLRVGLQASPDPVAPGQRLVYTITVSNTGSAPLDGVTARLPLPEYVQWVSWSPNCQGQGPTFTCVFGPGAPAAPGALPPGQSLSASITTTVDTSPSAPSFSATVTATGNGPSGQQTATASSTTTET